MIPKLVSVYGNTPDYWLKECRYSVLMATVEALPVIEAQESLRRINELVVAFADANNAEAKEMRQALVEAATRGDRKPQGVEIAKLDPSLRKAMFEGMGLKVTTVSE